MKQTSRAGLLGLLFGLLLICSCCFGKECIQFDMVDLAEIGDDLAAHGLKETGIPNVILNKHNQVVLTNPDYPQVPNFAIIQGVSGTYYGDPICIAIIDCGAAGNGEIFAKVSNLNRDDNYTPVRLEELCSNDGVFFGCVDTAYIPRGTENPTPESVVAGEFGDEIKVYYRAAVDSGTTAWIYEYSVWLSCKEHSHWSYELISDLMIKDSITRNIRKLTDLKAKVELAQKLLFSPSLTGSSCEDISKLTDLAPAALHSFEFLECIIDRNNATSIFHQQMEDILS